MTGAPSFTTIPQKRKTRKTTGPKGKHYILCLLNILENVDVLQKKWLKENQRLKSLGFDMSHYSTNSEEKRLLREHPEELSSVSVAKGVRFLLGEPNAEPKCAGVYWERLSSMSEKDILRIVRVTQCDPPDKEQVQLLKRQASIAEPITRLASNEFPRVVASCTLKEDEFVIEGTSMLEIISCCAGFSSSISTAYFAAKCAKKINDELEHEELAVDYFFFQFCSYNESALCDALETRESFYALATSFTAKSAKGIADIPFVDCYGILEWTKRYIDSLMDSFSRSEPDIYAPYFPLTQSSGWGKTKLCTKLCREYHSVYICCRQFGRLGDPKRSYIATFFLSLVSVADFVYFYNAFFEVYLDLMIQSNKDAESFKEDFYWENMEDGSVMEKFWDDVQEKCTFYRETKKVSRATSKGSGALKHEAEPRESGLKEPGSDDDELRGAKMIRRTFSKLRKYTGQTKCRFLFVFDEFDSILAPSADNNRREPGQFHNWRRAILLMKFEYFNIVLNTIAKLANFSPPPWKDSSLRVVQGQSLCAPVFLLPTINLCSVPLEYSKVEWQTLDEKKHVYSYSPAKLFGHARPLFARELFELADTESFHVACKRMTDFATAKLFCGTSLNCKDEETRGYNYLSLVAMRYPVVPLDHGVADTLVASHMATLLAVNATRTMLKCYYVPEPILAEAACQNMREEKDFFEAIVHMETWLKSCHIGSTSQKGGIGELIAAIALSRAYDLSVMDSGNEYFSEPITLSSFVKALTGLEFKGKGPLGGILSFTRWHQVTVCLEGNSSMLTRAFDTRTGIVCCPGEGAIDMVIPMQTFVGSDWRFSAIFVQVKNIYDPLYLSTRREISRRIEERATEMLGDVDYMVILINVGRGGMGEDVDANRCHLSTHEFQRAGGMIKQVELLVPAIDALPERLFSARIKDIMNGLAGGINHIHRLFKEIYGRDYGEELDLFLRVLFHVDLVGRKDAVVGAGVGSRRGRIK